MILLSYLSPTIPSDIACSTTHMAQVPSVVGESQVAFSLLALDIRVDANRNRKVLLWWWNACRSAFWTVSCVDWTLTACLKTCLFPSHPNERGADVQGRLHFHSPKTSYPWNNCKSCSSVSLPLGNISMRQVEHQIIAVLHPHHLYWQLCGLTWAGSSRTSHAFGDEQYRGYALADTKPAEASCGMDNSLLRCCYTLVYPPSTTISVPVV